MMAIMSYSFSQRKTHQICHNFLIIIILHYDTDKNTYCTRRYGYNFLCLIFVLHFFFIALCHHTSLQLALHSMADTCLVILCGLPAVGKTYFSRQLLHIKGSLNSSRLQTPKFILLEYDRLLPLDLEKVLIQADDHQQSKWKSYRAEIVKCIDSLLDCMQKSSPIGEERKLLEEPPGDVSKNLWEKFKSIVEDTGSWKQSDRDTVCIIIDDNMYYRSMRYSYYQLARKYETGFCQIYLQTEVENAISQNASRVVKVPDDVITAMAMKMEIPDGNKNSWEENSITVTPYEDLQPVFELIEKAVQRPVQPVEEADIEQQEQSRVVCSESLVYQSDQILRKLVSQQMTSAKERSLTKPEMKSFAGTLQIVRKQLSDDLKSGLVCVPGNLVAIVTDSSKDTNSALYQFLEETFSQYYKEVKT